MTITRYNFRVFYGKNVLKGTGGNNIQMLSKEICPKVIILYLDLLLTFFPE